MTNRERSYVDWVREHVREWWQGRDSDRDRFYAVIVVVAILVTLIVVGAKSC